MNSSQGAVMLYSWGVKQCMTHASNVSVAGKIAISH